MNSEIHAALTTNQSVDHLVIAPITANTSRNPADTARLTSSARRIEARSLPPGRRFSIPRKNSR